MKSLHYQAQILTIFITLGEFYTMWYVGSSYMGQKPDQPNFAAHLSLKTL